MWSADNYPLPDPIPEIDTEIEYWYGEEEKKARKGNIRFVKNLWPQVNASFPDKVVTDADLFASRKRVFRGQVRYRDCNPFLAYV